MEVWALIFGGVGAVGGITGAIALLYAHAAFRGGKKSGELAVEANDLAKGSNTIALDARRLAMEANEYSHRGEQRETEKHDVFWEGDWLKPGTYILVKRGDAPAHNVKATVSYEGNEVTQTADVITEEGDGFEFDFPAAAADFKREVAERSKPKPTMPFAIPDIEHPNYHSIHERVESTTPLGKPKLHAPEALGLRTFADFYPN